MSNDTVRKSPFPKVAIMPNVSAFDDNFLGDSHTTFHVLPHPQDTVIKRTTQERVASWAKECFGYDLLMDHTERASRHLEEAAETIQAAGLSRGAAHQIIDMVFDKAPGDIRQEIAGSMVTLLALAEAFAVDASAEVDREIERIWDNLDKIREKQKTKPRFKFNEQDPIRIDLANIIVRLLRFSDPAKAVYQDARALLNKHQLP